MTTRTQAEQKLFKFSTRTRTSHRPEVDPDVAALDVAHTKATVRAMLAKALARRQVRETIGK